MKTYLLILLTFIFGPNAFASLNTNISCEMNREGWKRMHFDFRFLTPKRAVSTLDFEKSEKNGKRSLRVSAIHQSSEARYVGLHFLSEEKLVFIFLNPLFQAENLENPMDIEVVSSIYGPLHAKCRASQ